MSKFYVTVGRGTEKFAKKEICTLNESDHVTVFDGKVLFTSKAPVQQLILLNSIERLFVCILHDSQFKYEGWKKLKLLIQGSQEQFRQAYNVWREFARGKQDAFNSKDQTKESVHFRVSCKCIGNLSQQTQDISKTVGVTLSNTFGWKVNLRKPDFEISVKINQEGLLIGIPLTKEPLSCRPYLSFVGLRSTVSWIMAQLANIQPMDVVLDPMCGCSTILVEAAKSWPLAEYVGMDLNKHELLKSLRNALTATVTIHMIQADVRALPLSVSSVDHIICDLPFGVQHLTVEEAKKLYPIALAEMYRVLKPGGTAILLTSADLVDFLLQCVQSGSCVATEQNTLKRQTVTESGATETDEIVLPHTIIETVEEPTKKKCKLVGVANVSGNAIIEKETTGSEENVTGQDSGDSIKVIGNSTFDDKELTLGCSKGKNSEKRCSKPLSWGIELKHYLKLGETHAYVCVLQKNLDVNCTE